MIGLPFVDKTVLSDDSAISFGSLILSIPISCALYLSSDAQKIKTAKLLLLVWNFSLYMLEEGIKQN